jgi:glycosyltransferase involved in cell wall biosynthesis
VHVALITDGVYPWMLGGIQRHTAMLAHHLARAGARVTLLHSAATAEGRAKAAALEGFPADVRDGIRSLVVEPVIPGRYPGHYVHDCRRYSRALLDRYQAERVEADCIYAQGLTGIEFVCARHRKGTNLPPVGVHPHGLEMFQPAADWRSWAASLPLRRAMRAQCRRADWVFSFPGKIRGLVERECGVRPDRVVVTTNAVDSSWIVAERAVATSRRRFVFVGRHERRKGMPELLEAIHPLHGAGLEFHFVGPVPDDLRLRRDDVVYHGTVTDTRALQGILDAADVLLCPSWSEGMPTVVIEGMARGLAVLATDVGATSRWVDAGNGILLPRPDVAALRAAIERLWRMDAEGFQALQRESLARARQSTWDAVAAATLRDLEARL